MKNSKSIFLLTIIFVFVIVSFACGSSETSISESTEIKPTDIIENPTNTPEPIKYVRPHSYTGKREIKNINHRSDGSVEEKIFYYVWSCKGKPNDQYTYCSYEYENCDFCEEPGLGKIDRITGINYTLDGEMKNPDLYTPCSDSDDLFSMGVLGNNVNVCTRTSNHTSKHDWESGKGYWDYEWEDTVYNEAISNLGVKRESLCKIYTTSDKYTHEYTTSFIEENSVLTELSFTLGQYFYE